ncbi:MAG TPA: pyridoxal-dependent decarboxylase [Thermomicrobiales bacterium]|nr:pyridoxal-dependent decarboxylase [Thermomicrobiales bacterium]
MTASTEDDRSTKAISALRRASVLAERWLADLPDRPIDAGATPEQMAKRLDGPLPETGLAPDDAVAEWLDHAEPGIVPINGPRYFGFVMGGTLPAALGGDILTSTIDQNSGMWSMSPASAQTELTVIRWLKELFGLPPDWMGVMTSGATMSNLVGLAAARQWAGEKLGFNAAEDGLGGQPAITIVSSDAIHVSARKALGNIGLGRRSVRTVPAPEGHADIDALADLLHTVDGPVIVVGNAGEVNTGQFDDLQAFAELCRNHPGGAWLHVDAAFGLFAAASSDHRHLLAGIEHADSVGADAHKWLNVPYGSGFAFVRDEEVLRAAFATTGAAYLAASGGWGAESYSPEMSRRARAIPAWCALRSLGREGYRELVDRCIGNARKLAEWVDAESGLELMNADRMRETPFMIVCVRFTNPSWDDEEHDRRNRERLASLQADGRVYASTTVWDGKAAMRFAFDNWMTTEADVETICAVLRELRDQQTGA